MSASSTPARRVLLVHTEWGVYLGSCMGLGFWSKLDAVGQDAATTFESRDEALAWIKTWDYVPDTDDLSFFDVDADVADGYASIDACVRAGAERWTP